MANLVGAPCLNNFHVFKLLYGFHLLGTLGNAILYTLLILAALLILALTNLIC